MVEQNVVVIAQLINGYWVARCPSKKCSDDWRYKDFDTVERGVTSHAAGVHGIIVDRVAKR